MPSHIKELPTGFIESYSNKRVPWGPVGFVVYKRTYSRLIEDLGRTEEWHETVGRCTNGILKLGGLFTQEEAQKLYDHVFNLRMCFSGRALWQLGTDNMMRIGADSLQNCFSGGTEILTRNGVKTFLECNTTEELFVRTPSGYIWQEGRINSFGPRELLKVTFSTGDSVLATKDHQWITANSKNPSSRVPTTELLGMRVPLRQLELAGFSEEGYAHGFVFGDGNVRPGYGTEVSLFGQKSAMAPILSKFSPETSWGIKGELVPHFNNLPDSWKELPETQDPEYALGFILGLITSDGNVRYKGIRIHNKDRATMLIVRKLAQSAGLLCGQPYLDSTINPFNGKPRELWCMTINSANLTEDYFVREDQSENFRQSRRPKTTEVTSVEETGIVEETWCAQVPGNHNFTLANGVVTGNCWAVAVNDPIDPFCFTFNQLMLGGGVGFNITPEEVYSLPTVEFSPDIKHVQSYDCDFIVPDNREGWVKLLGRVLKAFFYTGRRVHYCTRGLRSRGEPIRTFGGTASGDVDLVWGIERICDILRHARGRKLRPIECLDIMNIIGKVVVAGNVRRSAQIALGCPRDLEYMAAKNWATGKIPAWRAMSNNSVNCNDIDALSDDFWSGYNGDGEPYGFVNLGLCRSHGRLADGLDYRPDPYVIGTNPCVTKDTWVQTTKGPRQVNNLIGEDFKVIVNNQHYEISSDGFVNTGIKPVFRVETNRGFHIRATGNHLLNTTGGWKSVSELSESDILVLDESSNEWSGNLGFESGWLVGNWLGDGTTDENRCILKYWEEVEDYRERSKEYLHKEVGGRSDMGGGRSDMGGGSGQVLSSVNLKVLIDELSLGNKTIQPKIEQQGSEFYCGFLQGWFDADGTITGNLKKGVSIRLSSSILSNLYVAQRMLARLGINSTLYKERREAGYRELPGGTYFCEANHDLSVSRDMLPIFMKKIGFSQQSKIDKFNELDSERSRNYYRTKWTARVSSIKPDGMEDVYDVTVPGVECFNANGIIAHNCAEITLENKEPCNLMEQFICRITDLNVWKEVAYLSYKVAKTISIWPFSDPDTNDVVQRNHRLGISCTGIQQATWWGPEHYDEVYRYMEEADEHYSRQLGVKKSIKLTTVKPSGTLSLLPDFHGGVLTPGTNDGYSEYHNRRISFAAEDPLVEKSRESGFHVEPKRELDGTQDPGTMVVTFPVKQVGGKSTSAINQLNRHKMLQEYWSDNAVSTTVYYRREELDDIKTYLRDNIKDSIKSVSFLLHSDHGFQQAPLEAITKQEYERATEATQSITSLTENTQTDLVEGVECAGGHCPIK